MNFREYLKENPQTDKLQPNSTVRVYHATREMHLQDFLKGGVDATKVKSRQYNQGKERGLYVTTDLATARSFGNWIIEFDVKGKDLYPTNTFGASKSARSDKKFTDFLKEKYPKSFRPWVSYMMDNNSEPQAMFLGYLPINKIKNIHHFDYGEKGQPLKTYSVKQAKELLDAKEGSPSRSYNWSLNMSAENVLKHMGEVQNRPYDEIKSVIGQEIKNGFGFGMIDDLFDEIGLPRKLIIRLHKYFKV